MTRDSELASFSPLSPKVKQISSSLFILGNAGFWLQLVLGIVSIILLLISTPLLNSADNEDGSVNFTLFCASIGVITLAVSIFFFFRRYISIGNALKRGNTQDRPKKLYTIRLIKLGLTSNLVGMFVSIIGAESFAGLLFSKASKIGSGQSYFANDQLINSVEIMTLLANVHTIFSHFVGLVIGLWLINRISK